jgi:phytoene dehydrogenase-like protein
MTIEFAKEYDVIVAGGGLGGLTAANILGRNGYKVLLVEQHFQLGGLATYFKRKQHIFDVALHGFPVGMKKTLRKYWSREMAEHIVQVKSVRYDNPQFSVDTDFTEVDFTNKLVSHFGVPRETAEAFYTELAGMNFYDDNNTTNRELFEKYFPGRNDIVRFLMEPITYANGSTLDEPAITYGIVFSGLH